MDRMILRHFLPGFSQYAFTVLIAIRRSTYDSKVAEVVEFKLNDDSEEEQVFCQDCD